MFYEIQLSSVQQAFTEYPKREVRAIIFALEGLINWLKSENKYTPKTRYMYILRALGVKLWGPTEPPILIFRWLRELNTANIQVAFGRGALHILYL